MKQYIYKNALLARIKKLKMDIGNIFNEYDEGFWDGRITAFDDVICALNTLEAKEVNLEKEIEEVKHNYKVDDNRHTSICSADIEWLAKHFFELGLKARGK